MKKHEELRVGNYIFNGKTPHDPEPDYPLGFWHRVRSIGNEDQEFEQIESETEGSTGWIFRDNWCGIPLSEEWLRALGGERYSKNEDGTRFSYQIEHGGKVFTISNMTGHWRFGLSGVVLLDSDPAFQFVHHLQNLCQSFTGLKLIMKET